MKVNRDEGKELAFFKRYGKKTVITVDNRFVNGVLESYTLYFETPNMLYRIDEFLKDGATDYVTLEYGKERKIKHKYNRFLDAEITLADLIAEEN